MNTALHFSSNKQDWGTPKSLFDDLDGEFQFNLDPCATPENAKCDRYFTPDEDGLKQLWHGRVFLNPPYGREIGKWVEKAYHEAQNHSEIVVCLVPSRTDTKWWHNYAMRGEIRFIQGRITFEGAKNPAPFPSAIVIFRGGRP